MQWHGETNTESGEDIRPMSDLASSFQEIISKISQPGERSHQRLIGASQIGGCPYHLGEAMLNSLKEEPEVSESGLGAWIGTAVHEFLEHNLELEGAEH